MVKTATPQAHGLVLLSTLLVAGSFIAAAPLAQLINPYSLTLLRFLLAAVLLAPVVLLNPTLRPRVLPALPRTLINSFLFSAFFVCMFEAQQTTSSLNTAAIYTLVPVITAILSLFLLGERFTLKRILAYGLGIIGACWVIFEGELDAFLSLRLNRGDLVFLLGTLLMGGYAVSMRKLYRGDPMIVLVFGILVGGVLWMSLALLLTGSRLDWQQLDLEAFGYMAYLVLGATLATVYIFQRATVALSPSRVNAYVYLNPACVALLALILGQGEIPLAVVPGIVISAVATLVLQRSADKH